MAKLKRLTLKQAREKKGWTQIELQTYTQRVDDDGRGVDQRVISKIESHGVEDPMNSTVALLETALGLTRGTLVFGTDAAALDNREVRA